MSGLRKAAERLVLCEYDDEFMKGANGELWSRMLGNSIAVPCVEWFMRRINSLT